jgi:diguanylate cyclase (GGDEF)-like protein/PAS domain S-box-containing protein
MEPQRTRTLVLLVDDSPTQRQHTARALEDAGFRVQLAADGREALEQVRRWQPDVILSDVLMPVMDGFALCRELRRDPAFARVPLVLHTSTFVDPRDEQFALALGATCFVLKPANPAEIVEHVREALDAGSCAPPHMPVLATDDGAFVRGYTERLATKLEQNVAELEAANRHLRRQNQEIATARDHLVQLLAERERAEARRARLAAILEATTDFVATADEAGWLLYLNSSARAMLGISDSADVLNVALADVFPAWAQSLVLGQAIPAAVQDGTWSGETAILQQDGREIAVSLVLIAHQASQGTGAVISLIARDITERKALEDQLTHQAFHDPLTALPNRALLMERLQHVLTRATRHEEAGAVLFLDLDRFKVVNDSLGHTAGDQLLIAVSERLTTCIRSTEMPARINGKPPILSTVARLGGDEFAILLEDLQSINDAARVAEHITEQLCDPFHIAGQELFVTASIGLVLSTPEYHRPEDLLRDADVAMYRAKNRGRACYEIFDPSMNLRAMERLQLETGLRHALERGELRVYYQPKVSLATGRIVATEALVRWERPEHGLMAPSEFVPLAEETGMILAIGEWVLQEACRQTRLWQAAYPTEPPLSTAINLSARQFQHPDLVDQVKRVLNETGLEPSCLNLEITESVAMEDAEAAICELGRLQGLGIQLDIDDFGTGYSSLSYLKRFPVNTLKIDRTFVSGLGEDTGDSAIVRATITLGHTLGMQVTAEGIETAAQLDQLRALGCDLGQGYFFARPLSSIEMEVLLRQAPRW